MREDRPEQEREAAALEAIELLLRAKERPLTLKECAVLLGLSRERIRQIERAALVKLRALAPPSW